MSTWTYPSLFTVCDKSWTEVIERERTLLLPLKLINTRATEERDKKKGRQSVIEQVNMFIKRGSREAESSEDSLIEFSKVWNFSRKSDESALNGSGMKCSQKFWIKIIYEKLILISFSYIIFRGVGFFRKHIWFDLKSYVSGRGWCGCHHTKQDYFFSEQSLSSWSKQQRSTEATVHCPGQQGGRLSLYC